LIRVQQLFDNPLLETEPRSPVIVDYFKLSVSCWEIFGGEGGTPLFELHGACSFQNWVKRS